MPFIKQNIFCFSLFFPFRDTTKDRGKSKGNAFCVPIFMMPSIIFALIFAFVFTSCSLKDDFPAEEEQTLKTQVENNIMYNYWTTELEGDLLTKDLKTSPGLSQKIVPTSITTAASQASLPPVYPMLKDFGSLDLSLLSDNYLKLLDDFCLSFCGGEDCTAFFSNNHLFFFFFFMEDFKNVYREVFQKEYNKEDFLQDYDDSLQQDAATVSPLDANDATEDASSGDTLDVDIGANTKNNTDDSPQLKENDTPPVDTDDTQTQTQQMPILPKYKIFSSFVKGNLEAVKGGLEAKDDYYKLQVRFFMNAISTINTKDATDVTDTKDDTDAIDTTGYYLDADVILASDKIDQITLKAFSKQGTQQEQAKQEQGAKNASN